MVGSHRNTQRVYQSIVDGAHRRQQRPRPVTEPGVANRTNVDDDFQLLERALGIERFLRALTTRDAALAERERTLHAHLVRLEQLHEQRHCRAAAALAAMTSAQ